MQVGKVIKKETVVIRSVRQTVKSPYIPNPMSPSRKEEIIREVTKVPEREKVPA